MNRPKRDWTEIQERATQAARQLGHELGTFAHRDQNAFLKKASCTACSGCCWVAYTPTRGFSAGGRVLKYRCGDPLATGSLSQ